MHKFDFTAPAELFPSRNRKIANKVKYRRFDHAADAIRFAVEELPEPLLMAGAVDTRGVQFWFMAVRAMIAMIPPVVVALLAQRFIVRGLTLGAVKG